MRSLVRHVLIGHPQARYRVAHWTFVAIVVFGTTVTAYASGLFTVAGCVVFIPGDAALVGFVVAALVGYVRSGLVAAWLVTFASLLGFHADHAFFGLSYRPFRGQLTYFIDSEGLVVLGVEGLVIGLLASAVGVATRSTVDAIRAEVLAHTDN